LGLRIWGSGFRVQGLRFWVWGFELKKEERDGEVSGLGLSAADFGFIDSGLG
jgi:hypothetical protein